MLVTVLEFMIYDFGFATALLSLASFLLIVSLKIKKVNIKLALYNISAILIAFFIYELYPYIYFEKNVDVVFSGTYADNENVNGKKDFVGYGPIEDSSFQVTAIRKNDGIEVFNVIYTLENGERLVKSCNKSTDKNVFFLGCSHIFGDGLNDNQTLPFFFNKFTQGNYHVRNMGFSGYGTHQALKIVENKILNSSKKSDTTFVIYSFIPDHIARAAGFPIWGENTPKYEIEDSTLVFKGSFEDNRLIKSNYLTKRINIIWRNSFLYKSYFQPEIKEKDVYRAIEIIKAMNTLLQKNNIKFIMLVGGDEFGFNNLFYKNLRKNKIECYFIDSILSNKNRDYYKIIGDGHPNEKYNEEVANFLSNKLTKNNN